MKNASKFICIILSFVLLLHVPYANAADNSYDPSKGEFVFSGENILSYIIEPSSVDVSYDSTENALKMTVNNDNGGIDPRALLDISTLGLTADNFGSLLVIYKVPSDASSSAHATELFISAGNVKGPTAGKSVMYNIAKSNTYTAQIVDLSALSWWSGDIYSIRIDPFTSASVGDTMYIDSIFLCTDHSSAISTRDARISELNKIEVPDFANTDYICTEYEYDKYTSPFWKGSIVYNEAVYPIEDARGNSVYTLMYTPDEITSVYSSDFSSLYYEGIDYTVEGNKITFLKSGNIRLKDYTYIHPQSNPEGYDWSVFYNRTAAGDGKWERWGQSPEFFNGYINVTYTHSDTWNHYIPEQKSDEIPLTSERIANKRSLNIVFYGDSICGGANSSSYRDVYPYAEYWNEMIISKLKKDYGMRVNARYSSVGGSDATGMVQYVDQYVTAYSPDLVFIEFGVNDGMNESQSSSGSLSKLKSNYKSAVSSMIEKVRSSRPNCEFVLVAPFYANPYCHYMSYFEACRDALYEIAENYNGVTVADVTAMQESLLEHKDYLDFSGDNMCHPNDFMARIYAQVCLEAMVPGGIEPYTVDEEPPVSQPEEGSYSNASPSGYGWQWPIAEAYGYLGNYGTNGQDIELTFDVALMSSASEDAVIRYYTSNGRDIYITESQVKIGDNATAFDWGTPDISNWRTVTIRVLNGVAQVYIDGEFIARSIDPVEVYTNYQLLFSYEGCMAIDNVSLKSSTGRVYFDCDFEDEASAKNLMGEGLGSRTLLAANSVSYDLNGAKGSIRNQIKVKNKPILLTPEIPERDGYTFIGWSESATATMPDYLAGALYTADNSVTLYAVWEADTPAEPEPVKGDINLDGNINAQDINMLKRYLSGAVEITEAAFYASDINGDGALNSLDSNVLTRYIAGT